MIDVIAEWLPRLGASPDEAPALAEAVAEQMQGLPTPLRMGVNALQRALDVLPAGTSLRLSALPGTGEYVRLVRSLATVVYLAEQEAAS